MPIRFSCAQCQKSFKVADSSAGKMGRCSDCGHLNKIPAATTSSDPTVAGASGGAERMYEVTSSVSGAVFGPADKRTLTLWLSEHRITPNCQIKQVGGDRWVQASQFFPQLRTGSGKAKAVEIAESVSQSAVDALGPTDAMDPLDPKDPFAKFTSNASDVVANTRGARSASTSTNPYQAVSTGAKRLRVSGEVIPTSGDIGFIISRAFEAYTSNFGLIVGGFVMLLVASFGLMMIAGTLGALGQAGALIGALLTMFGFMYLSAGYIQLALKVGRGEQTTLSDAFSVGDRLLPLIGFMFMVWVGFFIPLLVMGLGITLLGQGEVLVGMGAVLIVLVYVIEIVVGLLLWPGGFLIVDRKTSVLQAFPVGFAIAKKNILQFIAVYILSVIIAWVGLIGIVIGVIFTAPIGILMMSCAYLNMSGQIHE